VLADAVVQQAAVAHVLLTRRPFLLAPLELQLEVVVLELLLAGQRTEHLAGDADRRLPVHRHDRVDLQWVVVQADRHRGVDPGHVFERFVRLAEPGVPAAQVLAVEQRGPAVLLRVAGRDA
jgi:hypothetical protein